MIVLRENSGSNIIDVKNSNVADNTGPSKTVYFISTVSFILLLFIHSLLRGEYKQIYYWVSK